MPENAPMQKLNSPEAVTRKRPAPTATVILAVIVGLLLVCAAAVFLLLRCLDPANRVMPAMERGDFVKAAYYYARLEQPDQALTDALQARLDAIYPDYKSQKITYEQATSELDAFENMQVFVSRVTATREVTNALNASLNAYASGCTAESAQDYPAAIEQFGLVIQEDPHCAEAAERIAKDTEAYRALMLEKAQAFSDTGSYDEAVATMDEALLFFTDDAALQEQKVIYMAKSTEKFRAQALEDAATLAKTDKFAAIDSLKKSLSYLKDDEVLQKQIATYTAAFEDDFIAQADGFLKQRQFDQAKQALQAGLEKMPDSTRMKAKLDGVDDLRPLSFVQMTISASDRCTIKDFTDAAGNSYKNAHVFNKQGTVTFALGGKFTGMEGKFVFAPGTQGKFNLAVYVDGDTRFSKFNAVASAEAIPFAVDLTNAQQVKIVMQATGGSSDIALVSGTAFRN